MLFKAEFKHKNYLNSSKTKLGILFKKSAYLDSLVKIMRSDGVSCLVLMLGRSAKNRPRKEQEFLAQNP
ncbi:hypothetical protein BIZ47_02830 [Helicobacter pylori]|nr:hypothetical protein N206_00825 [Helicobacter pylori UM111]OKB25844.1 hypothetical protein AOD74_0204720 [Helicobacter pylori]OKB26909.1 hypothetical protein AOD76_0204500 [Helicobacter pylori]OLR52172.1 hypothetical protein BIZ49_01350 [Helicobacter pylori]OLR52311.1 hypothetical protein BIZ47_02830 [Helicobacter pylori]